MYDLEEVVIVNQLLDLVSLHDNKSHNRSRVALKPILVAQWKIVFARENILESDDPYKF